MALKRKTPLKSKKRLNQISKTKRSAKVRNKPLGEGHMCEFQFKGCTGVAIETHELLSGTLSNKCKQVGFQKKTCRQCHSRWHLEMDKKVRHALLAAYQLEFMKKNNWTQEDFERELHNNFIERK